jgi:Trk K+ transport system NAD-binding subunit
MDREAVPLTIIDRMPPEQADHRWVRGDGTGAAALEQAGVRRAVGIVAATSNDVDNLSIAVTARELNTDLFVIVRQNHYANHALFDAFKADLGVVPSEIIAHECLAVLTTPLLVPFLTEMKGRDDAWCDALLERLTGRFGWQVPAVWSARIDATRAPALTAELHRGRTITLGALLQAPHNRDEALPCEALYLRRHDGGHVVIPEASTIVRVGDELLLVGHPRAQRDLEFTLSNEHALTYVLTGRDQPGGWVWEKLARGVRAP